MSVIGLEGELCFLLCLMESIYALLGAEAVVCLALVNELLCVLYIKILALGLDIWPAAAAHIRAFVPVEAAYAESLVYLVHCTLDISFEVGILYPEDKVTAVLSGDDIGIYGSPEIAYMHKACGARCKSCSYP